MTAVAVMQLVQRHLAGLDIPVTSYISSLSVDLNEQIMVRQLLSQTSGIKGYKNSGETESNVEFPNLEEAVGVFADRKLEFEPGSDFLYTTHGYVVLGLVLAEASGLRFEGFMQQNIWDPAGMTDTSVERSKTDSEDRSELYHLKKRNAQRAKRNNLTNRIPGGGLDSTAEDLLKFGQAVLNSTLIREGSLMLMSVISYPCAKCNPYGLGWYLYGQQGNENAVIGHEGGQTGANTQLMLKPGLNAAVVVVSNTSGTGNGVILFAVDLIKAAGT